MRFSKFGDMTFCLPPSFCIFVNFTSESLISSNPENPTWLREMHQGARLIAGHLGVVYKVGSSGCTKKRSPAGEWGYWRQKALIIRHKTWQLLS